MTASHPSRRASAAFSFFFPACNMSLSRVVLNFSAGLSLGFVTVVAVLPESQWPLLYEGVFKPTREAFRTVKFWTHYYQPAVARRRQQEEIIRKREEEMKVEYVPETPQEMRRKVTFWSDVNYRIRKAEMLSSSSGISKRDREEIIHMLMKKHYPELFSDGPEEFKQSMEAKRQIIEERVKSRVAFAKESGADGYH